MKTKRKVLYRFRIGVLVLEIREIEVEAVEFRAVASELRAHARTDHVTALLMASELRAHARTHDANA